jgi:hypothetical protein
MHNAMTDSYPIDNLSNIKCCVPFWSSSGDISRSLDDRRQYKDSQVESLVYHLLQSVNIYVGDIFFKGYPLVTLEESSTTNGPDRLIF